MIYGYDTTVYTARQILIVFQILTEQKQIYLLLNAIIIQKLMKINAIMITKMTYVYKKVNQHRYHPPKSMIQNQQHLFKVNKNQSLIVLFIILTCRITTKQYVNLKLDQPYSWYVNFYIGFLLLPSESHPDSRRILIFFSLKCYKKDSVFIQNDQKKTMN